MSSAATTTATGSGAGPLGLGVVLPDLRVGGLQSMAVRLLLSLPRDEFAPRVYTFDPGGEDGPLAAELAAAGVAHVFRARPPGRAPGYAARLAGALRSDGIDLVHCHNITALYHGARAAHRAGRLPVLFTEHDREMPAPWKHRLLHRWIVRRARLVVAVSDRLRGELVRYEGFPAARTSTLFNGVPDPRDDFDGDRDTARAELGWDARPVALAVGSLTEVKNHAGLIRAWGEVRRRVPEARLCLAGCGELESDLRRRAGGLPDGAVELLGERHDVARLLAACDVFVLPSHREGLSLSLIEAHGAGRASVAYDVGGNAEVLRDGVTGWLVPPGNEAALAASLVSALAGRSGRAPLEQAARGRFLEAFTHERMVARYLDLYRRLCPRKVA